MSDNSSRDIKYLNKDFNGFRRDLVEYAKAYYGVPTEDFGPSNPGSVFLEMSAYIGDVLAYYADTQYGESFLSKATQHSSILAHAQDRGYKPKLIVPAVTTLDVWQLVPSKDVGGEDEPDLNFAMYVDKYMEVQAPQTPNVRFYSIYPIDFSVSSSVDQLEVLPYERDSGTGRITYFLLKKQVKAVASSIKDVEEEVDDNYEIPLTDTDIVQILDVYDDQGNRWYEVPFLGDDTVFEETSNTAYLATQYSNQREEAPYILTKKRVVRKFTTRVKSDGKMYLQFNRGTMVPDYALPAPFGNGSIAVGGTAQFLYTSTFGLDPTGLTFTIRYAIGGGIESNVNSNELTKITRLKARLNVDGLPPGSETLLTRIRSSLAVNNPVSATGGRSAETDDEIRENALAYYAAQARCVTPGDYKAITLAMPARYGSIAKAYSRPSPVTPGTIDLFTLSYGPDGTLVSTPSVVRDNLRTYFSMFKGMLDTINEKDGYIINFGVDFVVLVNSIENKAEVITRCIEALREHFAIQNWDFNQPIIIDDIVGVLGKVTGVRAVDEITIVNKYDISEGYSGVLYNCDAAKDGGMIVPPAEPSVFELRFPFKDIRGRAR